MTISAPAWTKWINDHTTSATYNENADKVKDLCKAADGKKNFEALTGHKNLVLLTKPAMGAKCQASFYHSSVGCPILPDEMHHCARIGLKTGTGMEVEPQSLFQHTDAIRKPSLLSMMKAMTKRNLKVSQQTKRG